MEDARAYARRHGLMPVFIGLSCKAKGVYRVHPLTVEQWIGLFAHAETVFTASYHGMLFSMYFEKPFFYYDRGNTPKIPSLAASLGIKERKGIAGNIERDAPIDYARVGEAIARKRDYSWDLLRSRLSFATGGKCGR